MRFKTFYFLIINTKAVVMMSSGGIMVAIGVEESNLHKRIALFVLKTFGSSPKSYVDIFFQVFITIIESRPYGQ